MAKQHPSEIVGIWRLLTCQFHAVSSPSIVVQPLGPSPSGRFVITAGGYTSCILTSPEASAPISTGWMQASAEEIARVARTMTAYCGPYRAWEENNETFLATNVEISLNPEWIGGEQVRRWTVIKEPGRTLLTLRPVQELELAVSSASERRALDSFASRMADHSLERNEVLSKAGVGEDGRGKYALS
jgi:hypothetical protein